MTWLTQHILSILIFLPIVAALWVWVMPARDPAVLRRTALLASLATLVVAIAAAVMFQWQTPARILSGTPGLIERYTWIGGGGDVGTPLRVQFYVGVDGISLPLILLTALLTPLAIWASFSSIRERVREYYGLLLLLHGAMLGVFAARDLLLFYVFFEFTLIPLFFLIGIWGSSQRRRAADTFFIYTFAGSVLTFAGVLYLGWQGYAHLVDSATGQRVFSFELDHLYRLATEGHLSANAQVWLFLAFFAGFAIKVPLFPFHTWLPLAHTEAPTAGSAILAGVLLKLGTYGFLRLSLPMLPEAGVQCAAWLAGLSVVGIIYGALAAWVQTDMKKLVAYSSVSHLGFCMLGMFSMKMEGLTGSLIYMVNHGLSTGALFLLVGMIYERYHTREMADLGGLARKMPIMAFFLVFFTLSSVGLPGLNGFIGEFLVLLGTFISGSGQRGSAPGPLGPIYAVLAATGIVLGAVYMFHLCRRVLFGPLHEPPEADRHDAHAPALPADLTLREVGVLAPLAIACLLIGVAPRPLFSLMQPALKQQVVARLDTVLTDQTFAVGAPRRATEPNDSNPQASTDAVRLLAERTAPAGERHAATNPLAPSIARRSEGPSP